MSIKKLDDEQVERFDTEYVKGEAWEMIEKAMRAKFKSEPFRFLDIGGGNGLFSDKVLNAFPNSTCVLVDNSEVLLSRNKESSRKKTINASVENMPFQGEKFDVIFIHWLLHHLVADSYKGTINNISVVLKNAKKLLAKNGMVSIQENLYDGVFFDNLPSHIIYTLSSSKAIAPLTKRLGANTSGCGVCFLSKNMWLNMFADAGFSVVHSFEWGHWEYKTLKRMALHTKTLRVGHFWCLHST